MSARRYRYTGKERDEETGLYYYGARYYAAWLGRWTAADPLGLQAGVNLYLFCRAGPVTYVDPDGMQEKSAGIAQTVLAYAGHAVLTGLQASLEERSDARSPGKVLLPATGGGDPVEVDIPAGSTVADTSSADAARKLAQREANAQMWAQLRETYENNGGTAYVGGAAYGFSAFRFLEAAEDPSKLADALVSAVKGAATPPIVGFVTELNQAHPAARNDFERGQQDAPMFEAGLNLGLGATLGGTPGSTVDLPSGLVEAPTATTPPLGPYRSLAGDGGGGGGGSSSSGGGSVVYRALASGESPAEGLRARSPGAGTKISSHVMGKRESSLISTTKDPAKALGEVAKGEGFNSGQGVVAIDLSKVEGPVHDASAGVGRGRVFSRTKGHQEVLIEDVGGEAPPIPASAITWLQFPWFGN